VKLLCTLIVRGKFLSFYSYG